PNHIGQIMVAVQPAFPAIDRRGAVLEILPDETRMKIQGGQERTNKITINKRRCPEEVESPNPVHGPDADVHGAGPINAVFAWVLLDPIEKLSLELADVIFVSGEPVRLAQKYGVLKPRQFPRGFDVDAGNIAITDVAVILLRIPVISRLKVSVPW